MKFGIILQSNKPEHLWNTFRFANASLKVGHSVRLNLMNEGVEAEDIPDVENFDISKRIEEFKRLGGVLFACGSCLEARSKKRSTICPVGTLQGLVEMVEESDKVLVFG